MESKNSDLGMRVLESIQSSRRPYAVFVGRSVEFMPADGARFDRLSTNPERMAHLVGVFDSSSTLAAIETAIARAQE